MSLEHPLNEAESELEGLLRAEPSAHFAARVGERVASAGVVGPWWTTKLAVATGAVMIAAVAWALSAEVRREPQPDSLRADEGAARVQIAPKEMPAAPAISRPPRRAVHRVAASKRAARIAAEPEVVVDERQAAAIERLLELARTRTVLGLPEKAEAAPLSVEPLSIQPISPEPAVPATGSERSSS
jgi:hypothetical protein